MKCRADWWWSRSYGLVPPIERVPADAKKHSEVPEGDGVYVFLYEVMRKRGMTVVELGRRTGSLLQTFQGLKPAGGGRSASRR